MKKPSSLIGLKFGKLTVKSKSARISKNRQTYWDCLCSCGKSKTIRRDSLLSGKTKSCGCLSHGHRVSRTPEYSAWCKIKERCNNPNVRSYCNYGERGIIVCEKWSNSFLSFLDDMGKRPSKKHSIDRINNNGNYEPSNCRWATPEQQANNKSNNRPLTLNGKTMNLSQWVIETGLSRSTIRGRLKRGWPVDKTLTTPNMRQIAL